MYDEVGIERLSPMQISKLLKGGSVRVKKGSHHKMNLSKEQHKKLYKAHLRGAGIMIMLDPYQQEMHHHLHGEGLKSNLKTAGKVALGLGALALGHHIGSQLSGHHQTQQVQHQRRQVAQGHGYKGMHEANPFSHEIMGHGLPKHRGRPRKAYSIKKGAGFFDDVRNVGHEVVHDIQNSGRPIASHLIHTGLPIFAGSAGGVIGGMATANPIGGVVGGTAGTYLGTALGDYIGAKTGYGLLEDAVHTARGIAGLGLKKKRVVRKHKKGGALMPAGY